MYMIWHLYQLMQVPFIFLVIIVILNAYMIINSGKRAAVNQNDTCCEGENGYG
jgi:hypothetical protein